MKLLLINYMETTAPGGINKVVFEIARWLSKWGHEVVVFNPAWKNDKQLSEEKIDGFTLIRGYKYRESLYGFSIKNIKVIKEIIKKFNPDVVHIHGYHTLFSPEMIYIIKKHHPSIPLVFSPHLDVARSTFAGKYLWGVYNFFIGKKIFKLVDHIISPSEFEAKTLAHQFGISLDKISVISHGVDVINTKKPLKHGDKIYLLYLGYLIKRKRVEYILESLHSLVHDFGVEDVVLTIIGDGPEKKRLLKLAEKLGVINKIEWKSFLPREELIDEIKNADVFLLLSESEAYGIAVAEALALGTPVIVTKRTALREFLNEPGCFGVDYPPNPREVAELVLKIVNNNVKVGPFSKKIRVWGEVAKDYENVYQSLL
uniref:glycosyltransferase family 4 protein n=1 Tax=Thermococcus sp. TaxID=35749 RepID=UPI0026066A40